MENKQTEKIIYIENKYITAVDWLIRQQKHNKFFDIETIEQAKQMEKEQHDLTFTRGSMTGYANANGYESVDFEQYYSETYKQQDND